MKTEEEIIKALELWANGDSCKDCPRSKICNGVDHIQNAIDLIKRQKAELDILEKENDILSKNADTAFQDGLNEAQDLYAEQVKNEVRAESIKEFAERLKEKNANLIDLFCMTRILTTS